MSDNLRHAVSYEKLLSEKETLECRLAEFADREQSLMLQLGERDKSLAEAEEKLMGVDSESMMKDALIDTLNDRIRAASELVNSTYEDEVKIVRAVCHNYLGEVLKEGKLQDTVIFHLKNFKSNLVAALGREAEG